MHNKKKQTVCTCHKISLSLVYLEVTSHVLSFSLYTWGSVHQKTREVVLIKIGVLNYCHSLAFHLKHFVTFNVLLTLGRLSLTITHKIKEGRLKLCI